MKRIDITDLPGNAVDLISNQWMLVTAGSAESFNTMTANWGGLGYAWGMPVAYVLVRPNRYTHEFVEREGRLTLSFMGEEHRHALAHCGRVSGRDHDKLGETGLRPWFSDNGQVAIADADAVLECRVLFRHRLEADDFLKFEEVARWYAPDNPPHDFYIAEITDAWMKD
ncbi:MAG: flavin reductase family protein [Akkermansiaceae bacterium]|nr:flavin reductase family protein [Akkermansia sp.]MCD7798426.1 flavin reductase family protein [Akkermansiaceae bacterium]MCD8070244.1 flavin reductase family protein [Akkermansiaceae bacterium]